MRATLITSVVLAAVFVAGCGDGTPGPVASTTVTTTSGPGQTAFVMPTVTGMYWADAEPKLRALGWEGTLEKLPDVAAEAGQRNRIVTQTPPAGEPCPATVTVKLAFGGP